MPRTVAAPEALGPPASRPHAALTRPFREVATRSLSRAAAEPLPVFIPEGPAELSAWLALPRDRQALLAAIASRLGEEAQLQLRQLLAQGAFAIPDLPGKQDLLDYLTQALTRRHASWVRTPGDLVERLLAVQST